jgi:hypothetical protein
MTSPTARPLSALVLSLAAAAGLVWACGGDDASVQDGGPDATASDAPSPDAGPDAPDAADAVADASAGCDTTASFGAPVLVNELTSAGTDVGARLTPDGLTVYFASNRALGDAGPAGFRTFGTLFDIYRATRSAVDQPFGTPVRADDLDSDAGDAYASLSSTDLTVYFASDRNGGVVRLFSATRATSSDPFGAASEITGVAPDALSDDEPYVTADDSALYFSSARTLDAGISGFHVFRSPIDAGVVGPPVLIPVRTDDAGLALVAFSPVVSADDLTLYFASPALGGGALDVWRATRASKSDPFSNPAPVSELNTSDNEAPSYLTADGCTLYLHSNRMGGAGRFHIYRASKPPK